MKPANTLVTGEVFTSALAGDGTSTVTATSTNSGTGQILQQGLVNANTANAFQQGNSPITVSFAVSGGTTTYTATQGGSTISSGTLNNSGTGQRSVQLAGVDYEITGSPANNDSFTIAPRARNRFSRCSRRISTMR